MGLAYIIGIAAFMYVFSRFSGVSWSIYISDADISFYHELLSKHNDYFRNLSPAGKKKFVKRLHTFRHKKLLLARMG